MDVCPLCTDQKMAFETLHAYNISASVNVLHKICMRQLGLAGNADCDHVNSLDITARVQVWG